MVDRIDGSSHMMRTYARWEILSIHNAMRLKSEIECFDVRPVITDKVRAILSRETSFTLKLKEDLSKGA